MKILFHALAVVLVPGALALDSLPTFLRQEPNSQDERHLIANNACPSNSTANATIPLPRERGTVRFGHQCTGIGCTANDLDYINCTAVPANNGQCINCVCGDQVPIQLLCYVRATANSGRTRAFIIAEVVFGTTSCDDRETSCGISLCKQSETVFTQGNDVAVLFDTPILWPCGSEITFVGTANSPIILGSGSQSQTCAGITRCNDFSPKCDIVPENIDITPPLSLAPLVQTCDGTQVDVAYEINGGNPPFNIVLKCNGTPVGTKTNQMDRSGTISKDPDCDGQIEVVVSAPSNDGSANCTATRTQQGKVCCVSTISCIPLADVPLEGCNSDKAYPNASDVNQPPSGLFDISNVCIGATPTFSRTGNTVTSGNLCSGLNVRRTWTASIAGTGVSQACGINLKIKDTTPPVFTSCASSTTVLNCGLTNAPALANCAWTDNCGASGNLAPCCVFSGSGVTRTYTATDGCNSVSVVQTVGFPTSGNSGTCSP